MSAERGCGAQRVILCGCASAWRGVAWRDVAHWSTGLYRRMYRETVISALMSFLIAVDLSFFSPAI